MKQSFEALEVNSHCWYRLTKGSVASITNKFSSAVDYTGPNSYNSGSSRFYRSYVVPKLQTDTPGQPIAPGIIILDCSYVRDGWVFQPREYMLHECSSSMCLTHTRPGEFVYQQRFPRVASPRFSNKGYEVDFSLLPHRGAVSTVLEACQIKMGR